MSNLTEAYKIFEHARSHWVNGEAESALLTLFDNSYEVQLILILSALTHFQACPDGTINYLAEMLTSHIKHLQTQKR